MRILISNDDGIHAEGIQALKKVLSVDHEVYVVAPHDERSSCGHGITLGHPVRMYKHGDNEYACTGTPADCILISIGNLLKEQKIDLVITGMNHGANLGQDRYYSGTIAAAREATFRGIPAIATSLVTKLGDQDEYFEEMATVLKKMIDQNIHQHIKPMSLININFPNTTANKVKNIRLTTPGLQQYNHEVLDREDMRGKMYYWLGGHYQGHEELAGTDAQVVSEGEIAVTVQCFQKGDLGTFLEHYKQMSESLESFCEQATKELL